MKKVILVRHAKSSWSDPALEDHDRPLAPRGRRAAPVISRWLLERGHLPDLVLCSSSLRTRQTVELMAETIPGLPAPVIEPDLYHASPDQMRARLAGLPPETAAAMIVGHNPGLSALTRKLAGGAVRPRCARAFDHFPTAAAAVFELDLEDWGRLAYHAAAFVDFARPRELEAGTV
ncbi:histidine phosphatase family protein [Paralimibaculum aggregatum]|uniref:Histidine phosphatase family protein n=1 Tax=Paralimibaculum aggregatum TaxID=3036245 RepID=A0ABQ6LI99_9RHOB|nr:histidine phosphatase family protein [Limibaculum sp. NKW23]GMG83013.1 histidine phosphatase family protein [Limibaculum sp. NKW23]